MLEVGNIWQRSSNLQVTAEFSCVSAFCQKSVSATRQLCFKLRITLMQLKHRLVCCELCETQGNSCTSRYIQRSLWTWTGIVGQLWDIQSRNLNYEGVVECLRHTFRNSLEILSTANTHWNGRHCMFNYTIRMTGDVHDVSKQKKKGIKKSRRFNCFN